MASPDGVEVHGPARERYRARPTEPWRRRIARSPSTTSRMLTPCHGEQGVGRSDDDDPEQSSCSGVGRDSGATPSSRSSSRTRGNVSGIGSRFLQAAGRTSVGAWGCAG